MNSIFLTVLALTTTATFGKTIPNYAAADLVLGQANFTSKLNPSPPTAVSHNDPSAVIVDPTTRKVFVADTGNNRVLRYASADSLAQGAAAEVVFGQSLFTTKLPSSGYSGMNTPVSLCLDHLGRLWVADLLNHRVLRFDAGSARSSGASADRVYGQINFTNASAGVAANRMDFPSDLCVDATDRLWVADSSNNRVLRFDDISNKPSGANADGVLGQANFTTKAFGLGASGLDYPRGVTVSSSGVLFISVTSQSRVLRFPAAATLANGAAASAVLGQPDFATVTYGLSATQMNRSYGVALTADDSLWVCDGFNKRMLRFDQASTKPSGAAADGVVGQPDFNTAATGLDNRSLASAFLKPFADASGALWVPDQANQRVLRFSPDATPPLLTVTAPAKLTKKKVITLKGTASDTYGISKVEYRVNKGPLKLATGTTAWSFKTKLLKGRNKITVLATDVDGIQSVSQVIKITRK
jgi:sugar lactone lactonase YvrE